MHLRIQTEDSYIYNKSQLLVDLFRGYLNKEKIIIDLDLEGCCAESLGLYQLLDSFCDATEFVKNNITIYTANLVEHHNHYNIVKKSSYWYEVPMVQEWWKNNQIDTGLTPVKHFGNFVGKSKWPRLWMAAWLYKNHRSKTLQTFHSSIKCNYRTNEADQVYDYIGLEDLIHRDCDILPDVAEFLQNCPVVINEDLDVIKNSKVFTGQPSYYPLQHPANLNIINYYRHIFVDIVAETNVVGNSFLSTEKLWRCILSKRPFIMIAGKNHLYNLHKLGFDTFYDWWDESYDGTENQTRIKLIENQINEIATWSLEKVESTLREMQQKLNHNYDVFLSLSPSKLKEVFIAE
jgi:hypothetical protein